MSIPRVIDANANRAREALRVMEDTARFVLDDADLSAACKQLRHELRDALPDAGDLLAHRDTPRDVGTSQHTAQEARRDSLADLATAAGKRLGEALRTLEEFVKLNTGEEKKPNAARILPGALPGGQLKQLRYRGYDLEQRFGRQLAARQRGRQWRLCLLLTVSLCKLPWEEVLDQSLAAGVDCVQVREKGLEDAELLQHACAVVARCRAFATAHPDRDAPSVIINDRPDIAVLCGAHGVHLGQTDLPPEAARRVLGPDLHLGVSATHLDQARAAVAAGADYCGVGPMFPTTTKHKPTLAGPAFLTQCRAAVPLPHLAIGGITPDRLPELLDAGVLGIAVCAAIATSDYPGEIAQRLAVLLKPTSDAP